MIFALQQATIVRFRKKRYNREVKFTSSPVPFFLLSALLLSGCLAAKDGEEIPDGPDVFGAYEAAEWTVDMGTDGLDMRRLRPSSLLGVYVTHYLVHATGVRGALTAIDAHAAMYFDDRLDRDESFTLLEELGTMLQVDITDMLNRSTDRVDAFDEYLDSLTDVLQESHLHADGLEQELDKILDERREQRKETSDLQRDLNSALREQDYATAGSKQEELIEAESDLAEIMAREDEVDSIIDLFEDLIDIGEERALAMQENRQPIIAGMMVVEVPGIEDLGIIQKRNRRDLRNSRDIFDPAAN